VSRAGELLYLTLRVICYCALALVVAGFGSFFLLGAFDVCPRPDPGSISCNTPFQESLASFGLGVMLVSVFTGLPLLLALAGLFFLVRGLYRRFGPDTSESRAGRSFQIVLKYILIAFGVLILISFVGGIIGSVMG